MSDKSHISCSHFVTHAQVEKALETLSLLYHVCCFIRPFFGASSITQGAPSLNLAASKFFSHRKKQTKPHRWLGPDIQCLFREDGIRQSPIPMSGKVPYLRQGESRTCVHTLPGALDNKTQTPYPPYTLTSEHVVQQAPASSEGAGASWLWTRLERGCRC